MKKLVSLFLGLCGVMYGTNSWSEVICCPENKQCGSVCCPTKGCNADRTACATDECVSGVVDYNGQCCDSMLYNALDEYNNCTWCDIRDGQGHCLPGCSPGEGYIADGNGGYICGACDSGYYADYNGNCVPKSECKNTAYGDACLMQKGDNLYECLSYSSYEGYYADENGICQPISNCSSTGGCIDPGNDYNCIHDSGYYADYNLYGFCSSKYDCKNATWGDACLMQKDNSLYECLSYSSYAGYYADENGICQPISNCSSGGGCIDPANDYNCIHDSGYYADYNEYGQCEYVSDCTMNGGCLMSMDNGYQCIYDSNFYADYNNGQCEYILNCTMNGGCVMSHHDGYFCNTSATGHYADYNNNGQCESVSDCTMNGGCLMNMNIGHQCTYDSNYYADYNNNGQCNMVSGCTMNGGCLLNMGNGYECYYYGSDVYADYNSNGQCAYMYDCTMNGGCLMDYGNNGYACDTYAKYSGYYADYNNNGRCTPGPNGVNTMCLEERPNGMFEMSYAQTDYNVGIEYSDYNYHCVYCPYGVRDDDYNCRDYNDYNG